MLTAGDEEPVRRGAQAACRDAEHDAGAEPRRRARPLDRGSGRDDARAGRADVPAARDREVRRALRDPQGAHRGRGRTWPSGRAPAGSRAPTSTSRSGSHDALEAALGAARLPGRGARSRRPRRRSGCARHRSTSSRPFTCRPSTSIAAQPSTSRTTRTATGVSAGWSWSGSSGATPRPGCRSRRASSPTTCRRCSSSPRSHRRQARRCSATSACRSSSSAPGCTSSAVPTPTCWTPVVAALPRPTRAQVAAARRLAEEGPPTELVGLEPFAAGAAS